MVRQASLLCLMALGLLVPVAAKACDGGTAHPSVQVTIDRAPVRYDYTQPIEALSNVKTDTVSPYPAHYNMDIGGLMSGIITSEHRIRFKTALNTTRGEGCVFIDDVAISLKLEPTVYVARDFKGKACWFDEILAHEKQHVEIDRVLLREYQGKMTDTLNLELTALQNYTASGGSAAELKTAQNRLQAKLEQVIGMMFTDMMGRRQEMQQAHDSREEYERIKKTCQSFSS
ncbi:MAG: hypothetical protein H6869_09155 [Rhodospirillales bacterium]|nr:hypothetical protein [Rhodospirillales bacterium]